MYSLYNNKYLIFDKKIFLFFSIWWSKDEDLWLTVIVKSRAETDEKKVPYMYTFMPNIFT